MRLVLLFCVFAGVARPQGGPPMITDDPDTPGAGHWEINFAFTAERRPGERVTNMPLLDLDYGIGDRLQLTYEVARLRVDEGAGARHGLSNSVAGIKWRFRDAGEKGWSASMFPQAEFNNPGSHADDRGLVDHGTAFELPFQVARNFGAFELNADLGYEWRRGGNEWFGGVVIGREVGHGVELAAELHWEGDAHLHGTALTANAGLRVELAERCSLLVSAGRELHHGDEPRASLVAYLGVKVVR